MTPMLQAKRGAGYKHDAAEAKPYACIAVDKLTPILRRPSPSRWMQTPR